MSNAAIILVMGLIIGYLLYPSKPRIEVFADPGSMLCKKIEHSTTEYTHLCRATSISPQRQEKP